MILLGNLVGGVVAVFLLSAVMAFILRGFIKGQSQWSRMRIGVPMGTTVSIVISFFGTAEPYQADEWPLMAFAYLLAGIFWFVVALLVVNSERKKADSQPEESVG